MAQGKKHIPTPETRARVAAAAGTRVPTQMIAKLIGLDDDEALRKHYRQELDVGYAHAAEKVTGKLMARIDNDDLAAIIFYCKTQLGWREQKDSDVNQDLVTVLARVMEKLPG